MVFDYFLIGHTNYSRCMMTELINVQLKNRIFFQ